jgi:DNA-binding transcriptional ArsR family regulator
MAKNNSGLVRFVAEVSIEDAMSAMTDSAMSKALKAYNETEAVEKLVPTTLRLSNDVEAYYKTLASEMGISAQALMTIILTGNVKVQADADSKNSE